VRAAGFGGPSRGSNHVAPLWGRSCRPSRLGVQKARVPGSDGSDPVSQPRHQGRYPLRHPQQHRHQPRRTPPAAVGQSGSKKVQHASSSLLLIGVPRLTKSRSADATCATSVIHPQRSNHGAWPRRRKCSQAPLEDAISPRSTRRAYRGLFVGIGVSRACENQWLITEHL